MTNFKKFDDDMRTMRDRVSLGKAPHVKEKLETVRQHLVGLYRKNLVKINHSVIELLCAGTLIEEGYEVEVERKVEADLVCDVYGTKGEGNIIVEIETGFIPPSNALDPAKYCYARILSKTARYSGFANRFVLGTTRSNILPIPVIFQEPPRFRRIDEVQRAKEICDIYYNKPPISTEQITNAELHSIFIIDVDSGSLKETTPDVYLNDAKDLLFFKP